MDGRGRSAVRKGKEIKEAKKMIDRQNVRKEERKERRKEGRMEGRMEGRKEGRKEGREKCSRWLSYLIYKIEVFKIKKA